ncbi:MAG TPA: ModD protein [Pseudolabrys sp.]|nr:ModD protein [Pseudolabrys sp.]
MHELERLLHDDAPYGDLTTEALGIGRRLGRIRFRARDAMVVAAIEEGAALLELAGVDVTLKVRSGDAVDANTLLLEGEGPAHALQRAWKVSQTLIEIWSGVATATRKLVTAARAARPEIAVACTRKNVPGTKAFAAAAVKAGGAVMHRLGLSETILVFPEHRVFIDDGDAVAAMAALRRHSPEKKLVCEVDSVSEGRAAAEAGFDVIQAEKFSPDMIAQLSQNIAVMMPRPLVAAAGGVNADNAAAYALAGADILVTSWPYTARPADVAVQILAVD